MTNRSRFHIFRFEGAGLPYAMLLLLICLLAFYLRMRAFFLLGGTSPDYLTWAAANYYGGIARIYLRNADLLLNGALESMSRAYPPGYPAFIALFKLLGVTGDQSFRLWQAGLDSLACIAAYAVIRKLGGLPASALVAAFLYAIAPWWLHSATLIMAENLLPPLTLVALLVLLAIGERQSVGVWFLAGLGLGILPLIRPEMTFMGGVVVVWGLLNAAPHLWRGLTLALSGCLGFVIPWVAVASFNYFVHGQFFIANNVIGYVLASGLGQLPNDFGYFVDDYRATKLLEALGITYHSPESEVYWRSVYWDAWKQHPSHVVATILHRFGLILSSPRSIPYFDFVVPVTKLGPAFLLLAATFLWFAKRRIQILVVVGPLLYAMATNGIMYVETRYVSYAYISYILALALAVEGALSLQKALENRCRLSWLPAARTGIFGAAVLACLGLTVQATIRLRADSDAVVTASAPMSDQLNLVDVHDWKPAMAGAVVESGADGTRIVPSDRSSGYQALAELSLETAEILVLDYDIAVRGRSGLASLGVLTADGKRFLWSLGLKSGDNRARIGVLLNGWTKVSLILASYSDREPEIVVRRVKVGIACARRNSARAGDILQRVRHFVAPRPSDWVLGPCAQGSARRPSKGPHART